jgi:hypothetical protein
MTKANEPIPGTLNKGRIIGSRRTPAYFTSPVPFKGSDATKKGNREGNTTVSHKLKPYWADLNDCAGNIMRSIIKAKNMSEKTMVLFKFLNIISFGLRYSEMNNKTNKMSPMSINYS